MLILEYLVIETDRLKDTNIRYLRKKQHLHNERLVLKYFRKNLGLDSNLETETIMEHKLKNSLSK